jgi:nitrogen fixation protein FixH
MATLAVYEPGDEVAITFNVTDNAGADYDPASVKFHYKNPAGTLSTQIVGTDSAATKVSTGHYKLLIYIPYDAAAIRE